MNKELGPAPPDPVEFPEKTLFIIGVGRSGTSMLMTLLNGHSRIAFTPETHFLRFYLGSEEIAAGLEAGGAARFREILANDDYFRRLNISPEALFAPYLKEEKPFRLQLLYHDILSAYLRRKGKEYIGDKDPRYIDYLPVVKTVCPNAKIIHIYRDPRDVVLSKMKAEWSAHRPFWLNAMISQIQIKKGRATARRLFGSNYYELSYESLVSEPEQTLTRLLNFLELSYEPEMLDLQRSAAELVDPSEMQWKNNTFRPVLSENMEKWRSRLSPFQIRCIEHICREWFDHLGYRYSGIRLKKGTEILLRRATALETLPRLLYERQLKSQVKSMLKPTSR